MRYYTRTKSSVRLISDEEVYKKAIKETAKQLGASYELTIVEESFMVAAEIYVGMHLSPQEKGALIKEIFEVFDAELKKVGEHN